jgi:hypothetical protein
MNIIVICRGGQKPAQPDPAPPKTAGFLVLFLLLRVENHQIRTGRVSGLILG